MSGMEKREYHMNAREIDTSMMQLFQIIATVPRMSQSERSLIDFIPYRDDLYTCEIDSYTNAHPYREVWRISKTNMSIRLPCSYFVSPSYQIIRNDVLGQGVPVNSQTGNHFSISD
jgi:hypothetical protein